MPILFALLPLAVLQETATPPTQPPAPEGGFLENVLGGMFVPLALCFVVFWLLILRPESKNRKKRQSMLAELKKGDKIVTSGGLHGTVVQVQDGVVTLQADEGVRLRYSLQAIQSLAEDPIPAETK